MALTMTAHGKVTVVSVPLHVTLSKATEYRNEIRDRIDAGSIHIVFDMAQVEFMDSSGLSVLVSALKSCRAEGGDAVLCGLIAPVRALIELTQLHHVFDIFENVDSAVAAINASLEAA